MTNRIDEIDSQASDRSEREEHGPSVLDAEGAGPLANIRVIDFTTARSGPTCVRQLADMGADVVQVLRAGDQDLEGSDRWNLHRNKRSIILDLKAEAGREVALRMAERADVVVENWRPAVKRRLRLTPETLWEINPRLIYGSISGFGQEGPYAERPGLDQVTQGLGGLMSVTGPPGTGPWRVGIAISDLAAGTILTQGIVAALYARERTGRGQWVHTSLLEAMISFLDFQAARWLIDGEVPKQTGNEHPSLPAMATYRTRDGYINVAVQSDFERFFHMIGASRLASDARFADNEGRRANRDELNTAIADALTQRTTAEWIAALGVDFPCGPILSIDEVFANEQVNALELTRRVQLPDRSEIDVLRLPLTFSDTPASIRSGPHAPGADTKDVLRELGYSEQEIQRLTANS